MDHLWANPTRLPELVRADPTAMGCLWPARLAKSLAFRSTSSKTAASASERIGVAQAILEKQPRRASDKCAIQRNLCLNCVPQNGHVPSAVTNSRAGMRRPCFVRLCWSNPWRVANFGCSGHTAQNKSEVNTFAFSLSRFLSQTELRKKMRPTNSLHNFLSIIMRGCQISEAAAGTARWPRPVMLFHPPHVL